jgi:putative hydrolase of the HAD superfamily
VPFPDTVPALRALRAAGVKVVAASNWDVSLHEQLDATGLAPMLDGALSSAEVGAPKPDPEIFRRALALAGASAAEALHVGDDVEADVGGARAAGLEPVLIDRDGTLEAPPAVRRIASLAELPALCA